LFFSYTTLTTVGYGNLVPAGSVAAGNVTVADLWNDLQGRRRAET